MTISEQTEMGASAIDAFLGAQETGVLALRADDSPEPYAIPISYGYDAEQRCFYVRLVSTPDSQKRAFLASSPRARLVVYAEEDPVYRSVIATGTLEAIDPADLTPDQIEQFGGARRPLFEIWTESERELDIGLYQLRPTELNGRRVEVDRSGSSA